MRGAWYDGRAIRLRRDLPPPRPAPGEVVIDVLYVGICDTDIQIARGYMDFRGVIGHEFVGRTADGRRVAAEINNACHDCPTCRAGRPGHCPHRTVLGILGHDGAMADQTAVPERNLHLVPDGVTDQEAVFIEPLAAAFRMAEQVEAGPGDRLAVLGDGKLGLLCAWAARETGAAVHLIGKHPEKLALAGPGVTTLLTADAADLARSCDQVIDATGSETGLRAALDLVRPCGTIVLKTTIAGMYEINLAPVVIDEVRVVGSRCGSFPRAIQALARREVVVAPLIQAELSLDDAEHAIAAAGAPGARKIVVRV